MKPSEWVLLSGITAFAGVLLWQSLDMPFSSEMTFGPGFVPLVISAALLVTIALRALRNLTSSTAGTDESTNTHKSDHLPDAQHRVGRIDKSQIRASLGVTFFIGFMTLAVLSMTSAGVLAPLALMMVLVSRYFGGHSWLRSIGVTLLVIIFIYIIFAIWLRIPLH